MAITFTDQTPEVTRCAELNDLTLFRQHGTAISDGDTYDFGVAAVYSAWAGDSVTDRAVTLIDSGGRVRVVENEAGTVAGTIYAWAREF